ncbi:MAG: hypothetical protein QGG40_00535 [Myxococcota bacterium]|nr:hypothetical protein [Myxococcota bacterium]
MSTRDRREGVWIALVAVGVWLPLLWSILSDGTERFVGIADSDSYGTQWFYWFAEQVVTGAESPGHTTLLFFPFGKDILAHTGANLLDALLAVPFRVVFGPLVGFNLFVLVILGFNAWTFHRFARELVEDRVAVGVATVLFTASPYVLYEISYGRPTQGILGLLVLTLHEVWRLAVIQAEEDAGPRMATGIRGAVWWALLAYQYWYYALFAGLAVVGVVLWAAVVRRWRVLLALVCVGVLAVVLVLPGAWPVLAQLSDPEPFPGLVNADQWTLSEVTPLTQAGQEVGLFLWQPWSGAAGFFRLESGGLQWRGVYEVTSLLSVGLTLWWLWRPGRLRRAPVLAMLCPVLLVAMGPIVVLGSRYVGNPVYQLLASQVSVVQRLWWPGRAYAVVVVCTGLFTAVALAGAARLWPRAGRGVALGVAVLWLGQLASAKLVPLRTWDPEVPAGYQCLVQGPDGAVIEVPDGWSQAHFYYQTLHGRPLLAGMPEKKDEFMPEALRTLREENSFVQSVMEVPENPRNTSWDAADQQAAGELGFRYVVLQKDPFLYHGEEEKVSDNARRTHVRHMIRALDRQLGRAVYDDARTAIYAPWGGGSPCADSPVEPDVEFEARPTDAVGVEPSVLRSLLGGE